MMIPDLVDDFDVKDEPNLWQKLYDNGYTESMKYISSDGKSIFEKRPLNVIFAKKAYIYTKGDISVCGNNVYISNKLIKKIYKYEEILPIEREMKLKRVLYK